MRDRQSVFVRIGSDYYDFTPSEKRVADFILSSRDHAAHLSISDLAEQCGVSDATISRFCRRLGYQGFAEFKLSVANAAVRVSTEGNLLTGEIRPEDTLKEVTQKIYLADMEAITHTMEVLEQKEVLRAVDLLEKARRVYCMGSGGSMLIAMETAHLFSTVSSKFTSINDSHMQAMTVATASEGDVVMYFSYSGSTVAMVETMKLAEEQGIPVILVTRFPNSPGAEMAAAVLQCGANEDPLQAGSVPVRIAQLYIADVIFSEYCRRDMSQARLTRAKIARAMKDKHL